MLVQFPDRQVTGPVDGGQSGQQVYITQLPAGKIQAFTQLPKDAAQWQHRIQHQVDGISQPGHQVTEFTNEVPAGIQELTARIADAQQFKLANLAVFPGETGHHQVRAQLGGPHGETGGLSGIRSYAVLAISYLGYIQAIRLQAVATVGKLVTGILPGVGTGSGCEPGPAWGGFFSSGCCATASL